MAKKEPAPPELPPAEAVKLTVGQSYGFSEGYELRAQFLVSKKDLDRHGDSEIVNEMRDRITSFFGKWLGELTVGGLRDRAKKGMKTLTFSWSIKDPIEAYALGLDIHERHWAPATVVDREQQGKRRAFAQRMTRQIEELHEAYHAEAQSKGIAEHEELRENLWKYSYLFRYDQLLEEARAQGFSWIQVRMFRNAEIRKRHQSQSIAASG